MHVYLPIVMRPRQQSFGFVFAWFRKYRKNSRVAGKVVLTGSLVALFAVVIYGIFMTPGHTAPPETAALRMSVAVFRALAILIV